MSSAERGKLREVVHLAWTYGTHAPDDMMIGSCEQTDAWIEDTTGYAAPTNTDRAQTVFVHYPISILPEYSLDFSLACDIRTCGHGTAVPSLTAPDAVQ
jgi:hypothetical protein